jgi:menaquinone-dependent protoporphyrinogen oxidase
VEKEVSALTRSVLVAQASPHGPAGRAGAIIADVLAAHGLAVDVMPAARVERLDRYGAIVVGGPTRLGRWHHDARRFLQRHRGALGRLPVAVFATERQGDPHDGGIERALAGAPEIEPVTSAHFPVATAGWSQSRRSDCDPAQIRGWAEELARELGA